MLETYVIAATCILMDHVVHFLLSWFMYCASRQMLSSEQRGGTLDTLQTRVVTSLQDQVWTTLKLEARGLFARYSLSVDRVRSG